jgi:glycosyltransferase involved in cell wall biosynthesis
VNHDLYSEDSDDRPARDAMVVFCVGNGGLVVRDGVALTNRSTADFLIEIASSGCEICFCHWYEPDDDPLARTQLAAGCGLRVQALAPFVGGIWNKFCAGVRALAVLFIEVMRADFVYLYWPGRLSEVAARIARIMGKPFAFYLRGGGEAELKTIGGLLADAKFAIVTGGSLRELALQYCRDVENVRPMTAISAWHLRAPSVERLPGPWRLVYVGRVERSKGVEELIDACAMLSGNSIPVELQLVGHCDRRQEMLESVPSSIRDGVRFVDAVTDFEELAEVYRSADFFVLPSHSEGFPRVLYEAMAFGLPVVTTFVGDIPSVMIDGENCRRIRVGDAGDVASKIAELVADESLRLRIAVGGHRTISELLPQWRGSHALQVLQRFGSRVSLPSEGDELTAADEADHPVR